MLIQFEITNKQRTQRLLLNTLRKNLSEEKLLEQQFNNLLLKLNRDPQHKYFICREGFNTLPNECTLST